MTNSFLVLVYIDTAPNITLNTCFCFPGNNSPNVSTLITSLSSLSLQSVTSSTTTMVNSISQPSPPAVSSQPPIDPTNSDLPAIPSPDQSHPSTIITNAFAASPLLSTSSPVAPTTTSALFAKVNVSSSLGDSTTSHGPLIMSAPAQNEVGLSC